MSQMSVPCELKLLQKKHLLQVYYENGEVFDLPCEYLRVYSPSAEVRGHGQMKRISGKEKVNIVGIDPVGQYGIKLIFDDGHDTGIYSWQTLRDLAVNYQRNWEIYLAGGIASL